MKTKIFSLIFVLSFGIFGFGAGSAEAVNCGFYRDLYIGSRGSDVSCLQQYLSSGTGISLVADGVFGSRTSQALAIWQSQNNLPASGYFDSASRAKLGSGQVLGASTTSLSFRSVEDQARKEIEDAMQEIEDAREEINDSNQNTSKAEDYFEDALNDLFEAVQSYFTGNYTDAYELAMDAKDNAEDAIDEVDGQSGGDREDAEEAIEDAEDAIDDAEDEIDEARDRGQYVGSAEELLDEAYDLLDEAEEEFDDQDYDDAEDQADEARDLAEEAIDTL